MKTIIFALLSSVLFSCVNNSDNAKLQVAKLEAELERDRLLLEKKNNIIRHLDEYLPITPHIELDSDLLGGFKPGTLFIENKTGYEVQKVIVTIDFIKANGQLFSKQNIEFNNLRNGDSQSKPTIAVSRGTTYRYYVTKIIGRELTNGQELSSAK